MTTRCVLRLTLNVEPAVFGGFTSAGFSSAYRRSCRRTFQISNHYEDNMTRFTLAIPALAALAIAAAPRLSEPATTGPHAPAAAQSQQVADTYYYRGAGTHMLRDRGRSPLDGGFRAREFFNSLPSSS
jgi:hypothetical protein